MFSLFLLLYVCSLFLFFLFFFFNDTATTEIYTLSLHDALPISRVAGRAPAVGVALHQLAGAAARQREQAGQRSEEHTSELQSSVHLVCRLLLEKKQNNTTPNPKPTNKPNPSHTQHK